MLKSILEIDLPLSRKAQASSCARGREGKYLEATKLLDCLM